MAYLPEIDLVKVSPANLSPEEGRYEIEPLLPGFGTTLGNTLRRVLLSSIKGAAITAVKINDATHEFTTIDGVTEDVVSMILNLKGVRIAYTGDEPVIISLEVKGPKTVTAGDFKTPAGVEIINKDYEIAKLDKNAPLTIEARVENGKGYLPTEQRKGEELPVGMIAIDAIFSPIKKIHHEVSNTRVGGLTDFDKLTIDMTTDGSISANEAMKTALGILSEYITSIDSQIESGDTAKTEKPKKTKKAAKKEVLVEEEANQE